ncbi:MAG: ABC transporter [Acidobacteria bacterium]|nr:ABC transporter [Acidobacteriota bacterium]
MRSRTVRAILMREVAGYFSTPAGYVFISLFVFLSAMAAFWQERFFAGNLANLDPLNQLFPLLLVFFVPAVSMSLWAEEKKQGTEELLLTLPASDLEIVLGKYLAAVVIYTISLFFSLSHLAVLAWLGSPDPGLMMATYFGYWLVGSALLAVAMVASLLTDNLTVAFILGALFCAALVFLDQAGVILSGSLQRLALRLSVVERFRDLTSGIFTLGAVCYFAAVALVALYLNTALLGRRRWRTGPGAPRMGFHYGVRGLALAVIAGSAALLASQSRLRIDATSEQVHSLSRDTQALLRGLDARNPVFIYAYVSPDVPKAYLAARNNLAALIREFDAAGGEAVHARVIETVKYSAEAREALDRYGIRPVRLPVTEESAQSINEIFLGLAFTCGSEEFVIPFFERGLPVEYELTRSIRVVSRARRRKAGVLSTGAKLFGGFDFQARAQTQDWSIIAELRKQYEVAQVAPDADYPADLDVLIAALPHTLPQPQVDRLNAYVQSGKPVLLFLDPMPAFNLELAPNEIAAAGMMPGQTPPGPPRASTRALLETLGLAFQSNRIVWTGNNPHPQLKSLPREVVFITRGFNPKEPVSAGLQEVVLLYGGAIKARSDAKTKFYPLIETVDEAGLTPWENLVSRSMFGIAVNQDLRRVPGNDRHVLAARVAGPANAIVVADVDMMGEQFFELRRRGIENLNFDNVTFLLNAVDQLAGDASFIELRKRRPRYRTLEAVEARTRNFEAQRLRDTQQAEALAEQRLREAQARLDRAVAEIEQRRDIDDQAKQIMIQNVQSVENRRLAVTRTTIEDEKQRQIETSRADMENSIRGIQSTIKLLAVALPPAPALLIFVLISIRKLRRERIGVPEDRLVAPSEDRP